MTGRARIGMLLRSEGWRQAEATGLTPTQAQILAHLAARGPARIGVIATEIAVTQPTASDAVAALVRQGYVEKLRIPMTRVRRGFIRRTVRKSAGEGKSVSVRVDLGGRR